MAEVFESGTDHETGLREYLLCENDSKILIQNNQVNLVDLYEKFIQKKFDTNLEDKEQIDLSNVWVKQRLEQEYKSFKIDHQKLALFCQFNKSNIQILLGLENEQKCKEILEE